ncbi:MAG: sugar phosphate isomerase/epimerase family protein [Elusimicrobiota bacterium]|nr:sugar phosphate isomerase/epimerase family protein [Elusimicrobiota bacterium]
MKIGRNFTNMLETSFLNDEERKKFKAGELPVYNMDARVQIKAKRDIINQLKVGKDIGLSHIELDGGVPNPYLEISDEEIKKAREYAKKEGMTMSFHLPYTYVGAATIGFQESDRKIACDLQKRYIDVASKLGCVSVVMHPGSVPFYQAMGEYLVMLRESLVKTLKDLFPYAKERGIIFHLENNTAFDSYGVDNKEVIDIISEVNESEGMDIKYCFDIGHWLTIALPRFRGPDAIPSPPESIAEDIPADMLYQVHLNDFYINPDPKGSPPFKFHPPLHKQIGFLKKENLKNLARIFKEKGVETVVVETAVRDIEDLLNAKDIIARETAYLNEVFV